MILGASFDSPAENAAFRAKKSFPFALLCDEDRSLGLAYGACESAGAKYPARITVVIGPDGTVKKVYEKVDPRNHYDEVLADLGGKPPKRGMFKRLFGIS